MAPDGLALYFQAQMAPAHSNGSSKANQARSAQEHGRSAALPLGGQRSGAEKCGRVRHDCDLRQNFGGASPPADVGRVARVSQPGLYRT